ncbi:hypothetical protein NKR19_g789 [Coniochaeta hoffmannii]|uniref:Uncharacterized protein n=1 Tax=Coniochaeta hoffmannii TaxID=91930 RepID=A0AA38S262_9PEZI|nr:hypothetical protein NKR19_g789 [Coniochaeta hoffmannii]
MDSHECHGAAQAQCCTPNIKTITKRQSSEDDMYEMYLKIFLGHPVCDTNPVCGHGDAGMANVIHNGDLVAFNTQQYMIALVTALFWGSPSSSTKSVWDRWVVPVTRFASLSYANLYDYLYPSTGDFTNPRDDAIFASVWEFDPNCPQFNPVSVVMTKGDPRLAGKDSEHPLTGTGLPGGPNVLSVINNIKQRMWQQIEGIVGGTRMQGY